MTSEDKERRNAMLDRVLSRGAQALGDHDTSGEDDQFDLAERAALTRVAGLSTELEDITEGDVVDTADVARVSDTNPRSVARWKIDAATPRRDAEERLLELRAVVDLARRVMRDEAARFWLRSPNPDLGYEKPLDVIAAGRYQRVVDLLLALAEGVTA